MLLLKFLYLTFILTVISCSQKTGNKQLQSKSKPAENYSDRVPETWISHNINSSQLLELKDSSIAVVYWFIGAKFSSGKKPYYYKSTGKVIKWKDVELAIQTDKYKFYYNIWKDTLRLMGEAGIMEKLVKVY